MEQNCSSKITNISLIYILISFEFYLLMLFFIYVNNMEDGGNHLQIVSVTERAGAIIYHYYSLSFIGFVEGP